MRSDREELPEGFTKEDADKAEIFEAELLKKKSMQRGMSALAAPTDCRPYWPAVNVQVCGEIRVKYDSLGGSTSFLGPPTANDVANPDNYGRRQTFFNGPIYWSPATGAHPVVNSFLFRWGQNNYEAGRLKYPTTDEIVLPDGGRRQEFQQGAIYVAFQNAVGSVILNGPIRDKWNTVGGSAPGGSFLGYPIEDQIAPLPDGLGQMARFQNGVIYWSPATGAYPVTGHILNSWAETGYETGQFGYPTTDQITTPAAVFSQTFQGGTIDIQASPVLQLQIASGGYCAFTINNDRMHISTSKKGGVVVPPTASSHGWWEPLVNCPPNARANLRANLQYLDANGNWQDRADSFNTETNRRPGSGSTTWVAANSRCIHLGPRTWRIAVDAALVGAADVYSPKHYGNAIELKCS
ncbi:hypothetical protein E4P29_22690 [Rhodococcus sp. 1R11]|uniref:LGFP repeat-containing protein n=1 Tax=Rhodococcus sp. 1R11 TaxID=2559614 RepID=UPI0010717AB8|nr:LGFP repeat-containing protein [Rhodococcus sp. 1R11]TFI40993.1 hypothetical protein E4P29_22690 [Rhodococcus sp. 1R11]